MMNNATSSMGRTNENAPRVVVSVSIPGLDTLLDLEVPTHIPSNQLSKLLVEAISPETVGHFALIAESHGITLTKEQSLAEVGIWDGAKLVLQPIQGTAALTARVSGTKYPMLYSEIYVGRSPQVPTNRLQSSVIDLAMEPASQTVSKLHACLRRQKEGWTIERLTQARNPVWIDDTEITMTEQIPLHSGCVIGFGDVEMVFSEEH